MKKVLVTFLCIFLSLFMVVGAFARNIVADVSRNIVEVSVGYTGTSLLVFGSLRKASDVAIVVQGPSVKAKLWTKKKEYGIWVNSHPVSFSKIPGFYAIATSGPINKIARPATISRYGLSLEQLQLQTLSEDGDKLPSDYASLKKAQELKNHYQERQGMVRIIEKTLFRAEINLPASAPVGEYKINIYSLDDGKVTESRTVSFKLQHIGIEAYLFTLAHKRPFMYAFTALILSLVVGWSSAYIFRRVA